MIQNPAVTVVMPLYNKEAEVQRAIGSVLSQTFQDFEIIVVNDGSTDKGPEIVRAIQDSRLRMIDQPNAGVSAARNRGIMAAAAELIAFLDADDEWKPNFLSTIMDLQKRYPTCDVFATNYLFCEKNGSCRRTIIRGLPPHPWQGVLTDYFAVAAQSDPPIWTSAVAVTKTAIQAVGMFPVGVASGEDLLTWARLACHVKIAYCTEIGAVFWKTLESAHRIPQYPDQVSHGLMALNSDSVNRNCNTLRRYISQWHKMRAFSFLCLNKKREAIKEIKISIKYSKLNLKIYSYFIISLLPQKIFKYVIIQILKYKKGSFPELIKRKQLSKQYV